MSFEKEILLLIALVVAVAGEPLPIVEACNEYGFTLFKSFPKDGNVFISPFSSYMALDVLYGGARGTTKQEMDQVLRFDAGVNGTRQMLQLISSNKYELETANAVLSQIDDQVSVEFIEHLKSYNALFKNVEFAKNGEQVVKEVNEWVKQKTNGKITELVQKVTKETKMVLLNAVYFKGVWQNTFSLFLTQNKSFYNEGATEASVPTMRILETFPYTHDEEKQLQVIELPYKGKEMSMIILLPKFYEDLDKLLKNIDSSELERIVATLHPTSLDFRMPKFKLEDSRELKDNLESMGLRAAFNNEADFSEISEEGHLYLSNVVHKSLFEVNEKGSQAVAVTALILALRSGFSTEEPPIFAVDRPFLFFIRHRDSKLILFAGRVANLSTSNIVNDELSFSNLFLKK